jgi:hypothetical protein
MIFVVITVFNTGQLKSADYVNNSVGYEVSKLTDLAGIFNIFRHAEGKTD